MGRQPGSLLVIAILFVPLGASGGTSTEPEPRDEHLRMKDTDQAIRDPSMITEGGGAYWVPLIRCTPLGWGSSRSMAGRAWHQWPRTGRMQPGCWSSMRTKGRRRSALLQGP